MIYLLAWRNIWRNKMRSFIIMLSIAIGLFAGIAVLALYKGMIKSRVNSVINMEIGHIQIHDPEFKKDYDPKYVINHSQEILKSIATIPEIKLTAYRSISFGMLATPTGSTGVQINGVNPNLEYNISQLNKKIIEGDEFNSSKNNEVMIGKKLAKKMKLKPKSKIVLTLTDTSGNIVAGAFRVAAVYQSDNAPLDEKNVYITLKDMNALLTIGDAFHEIVLILKDDEAVIPVQQNLQQKFPSLKIESWKELSPETDLLINTTNQYSYIIMIIIMFALAFGIINTMLMAILERTREIGMMMALGTNKTKIFLMIMLETLFLTLAGTPFGILTGWAVSKYFNKYGLDLSGMGREMMSNFGFGTMVYPEFPTDKLFGVFIIVSCTAFISCLLPAFKALRLQPVDALRR